MLNQKYTRIFETDHRKVLPGTVIEEEGISLVFVKEGGVTYVKPSTGAAGETFAGFSHSRNSPPAYIPRVIESRIPESGIVDLHRIPLSGQIFVKAGGVAVTVTANAPTSASEVQLVGEKLFFFTGTPAAGSDPAVPGVQGQDLYVQFIYEPTIAEARTVIGDTPIGGLPSTPQEVIGVITRADIATTYYDASVDWSNVIHPRLGVDGRLTAGGQGTELKNVIVQSTPVADAGSYGPLVVKIIAA